MKDMWTKDEEEKHYLRIYGWLRLDSDGVERMHSTRETSDEAMARYRAYADAVKALDAVEQEMIAERDAKK